MSRRSESYNVNKCRFCGIGQEPGEWYWIDRQCSVCSVCAPGKGIMIRPGAYRMDTKKSSARGRLLGVDAKGE